MFWDKKKRESGLPDLPNSPASMQFRSFPSPKYANPEREEKDEFEDDEAVHELPSFPDSPMQRGFSQSAIKEAIANTDVEEDNLPEISKYKKQEEEPKYKVMEMEEWTPKPLPSISTSPRSRDNKPIFVRVDKFQVARNSLETVKLKLSEIESLLRQIRDVKTKEDAELSAWEAEMENIKARIQSVVSDIFDKAEY